MVAILDREPEAASFGQLINNADICRMSVANYVEWSLVIENQLGPEGMRQAEAFFRRAGILLEPVTLDQGGGWHVRLSTTLGRDAIKRG